MIRVSSSATTVLYSGAEQVRTYDKDDGNRLLTAEHGVTNMGRDKTSLVVLNWNFSHQYESVATESSDANMPIYVSSLLSAAWSGGWSQVQHWPREQLALPES